MRKKQLCFLLVIIMLCGNAAGMDISITDAGENRLQISGNAESGSYVTAAILSPGAQNDGDGEAIVFFRAMQAENGSYLFDAVMPSENGGLYTFEVQHGDNPKEIVKQYFYPAETKLEYISILNGISTAAEVLKKAAEVYSLENFLPFEQAGAAATAAKLTAIKQAYGSFKSDIDEMYGILKFAMTAAALEKECECITAENGAVNYSDILGLNKSALYAEYPQSLSSKGISAVNKALANRGILSAEQGEKAFEEAMLLQLIKNYKESGSGHVGKFFEAYGKQYEKYGFDLSLLNNVVNLTAVYTKLQSSSAETVSALAEEFPKIVSAVKNESAPTPGKGGSGSGGGGSSSAVSGSSAYIYPETPQKMQNTFNDINDVPWAAEAVNALAARGVISGKAEGIFAPNDDITRQEFVKILIGAFELADENAECAFYDVTDEWALKPVASASALGIVNGTADKLFSPNDKITREQGAAMLARTAEKLGIVLTAADYLFDDDTEIADYAKASVYGLAGEKIISGKGNNLFDPCARMTRAEAAKMIYGLYMKTAGE